MTKIRNVSDAFLQNVRYAVRNLRTSPGFAAVAILSLALGIGANTAIFSIINAVMLKTLPVSNPNELVSVALRTEAERPQYFFTYTVWDELRRRQTAFNGMLAWSMARFNIARPGETQFAQGIWVSGEFFNVLGVRTVLGRTTTAADDVAGAQRVAVISHAFWRDHFGGAPDVIGRTIDVDHHPFQIIGVTQAGFTGIDVGRSYDIAIPLATEPLIHGERANLPSRSSWWIRVIGRLKPGVTAAQADARVAAIASEVMKASLPVEFKPQARSRFLQRSLLVTPAGSGISYLRGQYGSALYTLMTIVAVVLLIGCANVANLLLARATARQKEIAIRLAIGASRSRIIGQLLTESLLLAILGGTAGIAFAFWGARLLISLLSKETSPVYLDLAVDLRVMTFTVAVALITGALFGLMPAFRATSVRPNEAMKDSPRSFSSKRVGFALGKMLVVSQVALSLVLLIGATLFARSLSNLLTVDLGFRRENILIANVDIRAADLRPESRRIVYDGIVARLNSLPGVRAASESVMTPISGYFWNQTVVPTGRPQMTGSAALMYFNAVSPRYFEAMGTPLLAGRMIGEQDRAGAPLVAVINETAARHFFGSNAPLGATFRLQSDVIEVIGVVRDAKYGSIRDEVPPTGYLAIAQRKPAQPSTNFEVYAPGNQTALVTAVREAIHAAQPDSTVEFGTLERQVLESINQERIVAMLSGFFSFLAVLLAIVGLYGVMSYTVNRRRAEIGIRMALGATQPLVMGLILGEAGMLVATGVLIGTGGALAGARLIAAMLYNVKPTDAVTVAVACAILTAVAFIAGYIPARRASRVDPMNALRNE